MYQGIPDNGEGFNKSFLVFAGVFEGDETVDGFQCRPGEGFFVFGAFLGPRVDCR